MKVTCGNPDKTFVLGEKLGRLVQPGDVILLTGDLGAGKTWFAKGVAKGLGVTEHVSSPTYTIINEYQGRLSFYHMDVYRLSDPDEGYDLGLDEYFYGQGVTLVEWPQRVEDFLPKEVLMINVTVTGEDGRDLEFMPQGKRYLDLLEELKQSAGIGN
ncbi:MAG: tRNA (adenosine(37)-N6)-threonylcarbamoyltransferase complex ATPase subunit type 1 TsaE [Thermincolia bacterium]